MNPALHRQLEQLGTTLARRNSQPLGLFSLPGPDRQTSREPSERPAKLPEAVDASKYRSPAPPGPSEAVSARAAAATALTPDATRTALYCADARAKLDAEAGALAEALRACTPALEARCDRRTAAEALHTGLVALASAVMQARGHKAAAQVTVHQSAELLAEVSGISTASLYRYLPLLQEIGLIDYRGNKSTATVGEERCTRADGTLIAVNLKPGTSARLGIHDFGSYRDLDADRLAGRTAYRYCEQLRESPKTSTGGWKLRPLLIWALAPGHFYNLPLEVTLSLPTLALEAILDVPSVAFSERCKAVETAAGAIAANLADGQSLRFWADVLWRLLRLHDQGRGEGGFGVVYHVVNRCLTDRREGFAKKPGALAQSRLRQWAGWEELQRVELRRVGPVPQSRGDFEA